jgi:hypothetical protein
MAISFGGDFQGQKRLFAATAVLELCVRIWDMDASRQWDYARSPSGLTGDRGREAL